MEENKPKKKRLTDYTALRFMNIFAQMFGTILGGFFLGQWLDGKLGLQKPIMMPLLSLAAMCVAFYLVFKQVTTK
jgi:MFS-type transporter involved in bile tolerance (Atg22 family)